MLKGVGERNGWNIHSNLQWDLSWDFLVEITNLGTGQMIYVVLDDLIWILPAIFFSFFILRTFTYSEIQRL